MWQWISSSIWNSMWGSEQRQEPSADLRVIDMDTSGDDVKDPVLDQALLDFDDHPNLETLALAFKADRVSTLKLVFHIRDKSRAGQGKRFLFRQFIHWIDQHMDLSELLHLIPVYGRWDDLYFVTGGLEFLARQLLTDKVAMERDEPISLAAKWAPTENKFLDRHYHLVDIFISKMNLTKQQYRRDYMTPLRQKLNLLERDLCAGNWKGIDYTRLTFRQIKRNARTFMRHDGERFSAQVNQLWKTGTAYMELDPLRVELNSSSWKILVDHYKQGFNSVHWNGVKIGIPCDPHGSEGDLVYFICDVTGITEVQRFSFSDSVILFKTEYQQTKWTLKDYDVNVLSSIFAHGPFISRDVVVQDILSSDRLQAITLPNITTCSASSSSGHVKPVSPLDYQSNKKHQGVTKKQRNH
jgi:hypothetical protein